MIKNQRYKVIKEKQMDNHIVAQGAVEVSGARVHNLKNVDVTIPHGRLTVITQMSDRRRYISHR